MRPVPSQVRVRRWSDVEIRHASRPQVRVCRWSDVEERPFQGRVQAIKGRASAPVFDLGLGNRASATTPARPP